MSLRKTLAAVFLCAFLGIPVPLQPRKQPEPAPGRPRLVVLIIVDQMRTDYIEQYGHMWTRGLRRMVDHGAWFRLAEYPYWNTVTCSGHATIATGTFPASHGIVLNAWWDRGARAQVACTEDPRVADVDTSGKRSAGDSPQRLQVPTLADLTREQLGHGTHIVSLSLKGRTAVTLAGRHGDAVIWYGGARGWQTSTFYSTGVPAFIERFVEAHRVERDKGKVWERALPETAYLFADDAVGERPPAGWSRTFPHALGSEANAAFFSMWAESPFSDAYLGRMAMAAVDALKLGRGRGTDFLAVGFSALDEVGHRFGPRSHEVQDVLVRLDATIGELLDYLDEKVGNENYVVALSSDHGVAPIPEQMLAEGLDAGRVSGDEVVQRAEHALVPFLGAEPHVARLDFTELYFRPGVYKKLQSNPEAMRAVMEAIASTPGVWRVFRSEDLAAAPATADAPLRQAARSYFAGRSGDLVVLAKPYWLSSGSATTHGSGHPYDVRVPVILMGPGIRGGEYLSAASPADIAPTLGFLCGVTLRHADGRVLNEALIAPKPAAQAAGHDQR